MTTNVLTPADKNRCQAEITTTLGAFRLGGPPKTTERCNKKPSVIVTELEPGPDGVKGAMSLCASCLEVFKKQGGSPPVSVRQLDV